jgi:hypothetical protein
MQKKQEYVSFQPSLLGYVLERNSLLIINKRTKSKYVERIMITSNKKIDFLFA